MCSSINNKVFKLDHNAVLCTLDHSAVMCITMLCGLGPTTQRTQLSTLVRPQSRGTQSSDVFFWCKNPKEERKILLYRSIKISHNIWAAVIHQKEMSSNLNKVERNLIQSRVENPLV